MENIDKAALEQIEKFYADMEKMGNYTRPVDYIQRYTNVIDKMYKPAFLDIMDPANFRDR